MSLTSAHGAFRRTMALITTGTSLDDVLAAIVEAVEAEDPTIACSIYLVDDSGLSLTLAAAPSLPDAFKDAFRDVPIAPCMGSCGTAAFRNELVIATDIQTDPLWHDHKGPAGVAGLRACWSQPIHGPAGEVLGTFAIYRRAVSQPDAGDIAFIESASQLAAIAIGRKRAEAELARSKAEALASVRTERETASQFTAFFETSLDLLCIRDRDCRFVKANKAWETVLGYSVEELEGARMLDFVHPDDIGESKGHMARIRTAQEVDGYVNRYRHKNGGYRHLEWRARQVGDLVFGLARDVTDRLAAQEEMAAAREAADAANNAKSEFLANMSHEIRTPLNGVIGVAAALGKTELNAQQREMVALIESSGVTLERLVSDVLDFSKIEAGKMEFEVREFDLRAEVDSIVEIYKARAQDKGLSFPVEYGAGARGVFLGDSVRVKQVLGNLLSNAIKFTGEGRVRVTMDVVEPTLSGQPASLTLEVEDSGVGMDPAFIEQLFTRFSQADTTITRRFGGSGLGLSITKALVDLMDGQISVESRLGRGTLFRVAVPLPRSRPLAEYDARRTAADLAPAETAPDPMAERLRSLRVLLAEDHPINRRVVQLILAPLAVELTLTEDGAEALAAFKAGAFDLVLMDMQMPIMDGLAATRAFREHERLSGAASRTPIVMLSANAMRQHRLDAEAAGADLHLAKPVTAASLMGGMMEALSLAEGGQGEPVTAAHGA